MRNDIPLTDREIETIFDDNFDIDDIILTRETIEDFKNAREGYNEIGMIDDLIEDIKGYPCFVVDRVQPNKGDRRETLTVVDFGTVRAVTLI